MDFLVVRHGSPRQLTVPERLVLSSFAELIIDTIQDAWPIDTGLSQSAWEFTLQASVAGEIGFTFLNDVDCVEFVHLAGTPANPPLWETLIPAVLGNIGPALNQALMVAIAATEREVASGIPFLDLLQRPSQPVAP